MAKGILHRTFDGKRYRLHRITGSSITAGEHRGHKRAVTSIVLRLRKEGYHARVTYSKSFGYKVWTDKPLFKR